MNHAGLNMEPLSKAEAAMLRQPPNPLAVYFIIQGCWAPGQGSYFRQRSEHINL